MFHPRSVAILLPLEVLGALALRPWVSALLVAVIATNVGIHLLRAHALHPRFLYVMLLAVFVFEACGSRVSDS
jgi:hypothetical protein